MKILAFCAGLVVGVLAAGAYAYGLRQRIKHLSDKLEEQKLTKNG
jgi:hypothetical protein